MYKIMLIALCVMFNFQFIASDRSHQNNFVNDKLECLTAVAKWTVGCWVFAHRSCIHPEGQFTPTAEQIKKKSEVQRKQQVQNTINGRFTRTPSFIHVIEDPKFMSNLSGIREEDRTIN